MSRLGPAGPGANTVHHIDADQVDAPLGRALPQGHAHFALLKRKLRWQLLVAYVTPLLLLSLYFHYSFNATLREGVDTHLRSIADNQRNTVDLYLQERVVNVHNAFPSSDIEALAASQSSMTALLALLQRESSAFSDVGIFDPSGKLVAYAGPHPSLRGKDYSTETWLKAVRANPRGHLISDVFLGFRGNPHFVIAVARPAQGGTWVLRASVDPEKFGSFVGHSDLVEQGEAFIVNAVGQPQTALSVLPSGKTDPRIGPLPKRSSDVGVTEMVQENRRYVAAVAWLNENDWALVFRVPEDRAYASVQHARAILIGIMLATLILIVGVVLRSTHKLVQQLEQADESTRELRGQLFNAAKLASVGEMAAGVAHEINNPLAIIYEEAGALKDALDPELNGGLGETLSEAELHERLDEITQAALRGRTITRKLLAFARQHDETPEQLDVNALLERVLTMKDTEFSVSNITVAKQFAPHLPPNQFSLNQLEQVLFNLLNNARDAMNGSGHIVVRTAKDQRFVHIDIEDNGCGMTAEQMEKVFFPFFTTKAVGKGTGLGLSISYGIIKSHGGRIEVSSEVGVGSTFTLSLPIARKQTSKTESLTEKA